MLIAENITLESRKTALLAARELRVESGSAALLIGDNNSGKSLLLQAINNRYPYQGVIQIHTSTPLLNKLYRRRSKTIFLEHTANCIELDTVWRNILLPMEKLSSRQEQKVKEFCEMAKIPQPRATRIAGLSLSQVKLVELIRAVIQLPAVLLIDDIDTFFDEKTMLIVHQILDFSLRSGTSILATAKSHIDGFWRYYRIQRGIVVQL